MPTSPTPFFVLAPGTWAQADSFLSKPLVGSRTRNRGALPWLCVATGVENGAYTLVPRAGLDSATAAHFIEAAQAHAQSQVASINWSVVEKAGLLIKKPSMARAILTPPSLSPIPSIDPMDDLSSEQLANPAAMERAAQVLGAREMTAVVPKRGWLLVSPGGPGQIQTTMRLSEAAAGIHGRAAGLALATHVFYWSGGRVSGYAMFGGGSASVSMVLPDEDARAESGWMA